VINIELPFMLSMLHYSILTPISAVILSKTKGGNVLYLSRRKNEQEVLRMLKCWKHKTKIT
jgi:hypothetical protein